MSAHGTALGWLIAGVAVALVGIGVGIGAWLA